MHVNQKVNIHNKFEVFSQNIETGETKQIAEGYNIVLDQMWTRLCGGLSYFANIHFGTGAGTPSAARTSLFTHLGTKAAVDEEQVKALPVSRWKRKIVLNPEEFVGSIITEVGISFGATATNLVTHAMLKDAEGNPISIEKSDTQVITIFSTVFVTIANQSGAIMLGMPSNNQLINYLIGGAVAPTGSFGLTMIPFANSRLGSTGTVTWTADISNKKRKTNTARFDITVGNGQAKAIEFTNLFTVGFPVVGIHTGQQYSDVAIGVGDGSKTVFDIPSWNLTPGSISAKLNGVVTSGYNLKEKINFSDIITPPNMPPKGTSVALSSDGTILAIGTDTTSPYVKVYVWSGVNWIERLQPPNIPTNGYTVALSSNGSTLAVGTDTLSPYVKIYDWSGVSWIERVQPPNMPAKGWSVDLSADGSVLAVGTGFVSPYVKVYDWSGVTWTERAQPPNMPANGNSVALSSDGSVLAVGTDTSSPYVKIYDWSGVVWTERVQPPNMPAKGTSVALSTDGLVLAIGSNTVSPYVKIYNWSGTAWTERAQPPNMPINGLSVALSTDGSALAVGTNNTSPYVKIYDWSGAAWTERTQPPNMPSRGWSVALNDDSSVLAVGANASAPNVKLYLPVYSHEFIFNTPPVDGVAITSDYMTLGVHKTDQYIIDASYSIQFGEGA